MGLRATSVKKQAVENEVDGTPKATATRVDAHEQTAEEDHAKFASCIEMELDEEKKKTSRSHAAMFSATGVVQKPLLNPDAVFMRRCARYGSQNGREVRRRRPKKDGKKICY